MLKRFFVFLMIFSLITTYTAAAKNVSDFSEKRIAVVTGTIAADAVHEVMPSAKILYFETVADMITAVDKGKVDAGADDEEILNIAAKENDKFTIADGYVKTSNSAFIFAKNSKGDKLRAEFNEYFSQIKSNGILKQINDIWFGDDENLKTLPDYSSYSDINGTVKITMANDAPPFVYLKDGKNVGYEVDIILRFCKEKGYKPVFIVGNFSSVIPSVATGKCDVGIGEITVTEERSQSVNFSEPTYKGGIRLLVLKDKNQTGEIKTKIYTKLSDLAGCKVGIILGANHDEFASKKIPDVKIEYFNDLSAVTLALKTGKIDAFANTLPTAIYMTHEHKDISYISEPLENALTYSAFTNSEKGRKICKEYAEFVKSLWDNGTIKSLSDKWIYNEDESLRIMEDYSKLPAPNGVLKMAIDTGRMPFAYVKDNKITGYDIELATMFCKAHGYGLEVYSMNFTGILGSIKSGKCDLTGSITRTEERAETMLFSSVPNAETPIVLLIMESKTASGHSKLSDFSDKRIGVQIGTTCAELIPKRFPASKVLFFNSITDSLTALKVGKIDAMCCALPSAVHVSNEDSNLEIVEPYLREAYLYSIFVNSDKGKKLCEEYSDFLKTLWDNGTIDELANKWLGADESKKTVEDYSNLPATNGTLKMAVDASVVPFTYVKDNKIVGHAIDLAVRFCKAKGYALEISNMSLPAVIASVKTGKCDFTQAMTKSKERGENTLFATSPSMKSGNVLLTMKQKPAPEDSEFSQLEGKRIGVTVGTTHPQIAAKYVPTAELVYFNSTADTLNALKAGKIDAACTGIPLLKEMMAEDDSLMPYGRQLTFTEGAPIFSKDDKGKKLCDQFTEFAKACWDNGTITELDNYWLNQEESKRSMKDYSKLPAPNGILKLAVNETAPPFVYMKNNRIVGYDIDFVVRFCEAYGYGLEIVPMVFSGIIPAVTSGKFDFAIGAITITDERKESVLFSYPNMKTGNIFAVRKSDAAFQNPDSEYHPSIKDFEGKKIGVPTGTDSVHSIAEKIPNANIVYFNDVGDILLALKSGKIDATCCSYVIAQFMIRANDDMTYVPQSIWKTNRSAVFPKSDKGRKLCAEYTEFIKTLEDNGTLDKLVEEWTNLDNEAQRQIEDYKNLPAPNGKLKLAADTGAEPFSFIKDNKLQGFDIELSIMFCKAKGYGLEIVPMSLSGILSAIQSGKCDFSIGLTWTEERAKTILFPPIFSMKLDNVLLIRKTKAAPVIEAKSEIDIFIDELKASFERTFIREDRYKLFIEGIMNTMIITVLSIFFGMVLGFVVFMLCRTGNIFANIITKFSVWLIKGTPIVVLLMILYYIIFGKVDISGIWVAVIAFSLTFGTSVYRMLTFGTGALDRGQTEAAYALGYTDLQTFFTIILPQAALHFMPSLREEVTMLIKSTAVVGYIAVQDLTKMGDIVRSRTYEAFFPLIAVAIIYFILAGLLNAIVLRIHWKITPSMRKPEDILRGINLRGDSDHD